MARGGFANEAVEESIGVANEAETTAGTELDLIILARLEERLATSVDVGVMEGMVMATGLVGETRVGFGGTRGDGFFGDVGNLAGDNFAGAGLGLMTFASGDVGLETGSVLACEVA